MPKEKRKPQTDVADWVTEEKRLKEEYQRKLEELRASKQTSEIVGQVLTRGILPVYVLHLLSEGPQNGNGLCTEIGNRTSGAWQPSTGGIYPLLRKFEKRGLVEGHWEDPEKRTQRLYNLTAKGQEELRALRRLMKGKMQGAMQVFEVVLRDLSAD